eukprot:63903-Alexandrium_andersonii.AAC.1
MPMQIPEAAQWPSAKLTGGSLGLCRPLDSCVAVWNSPRALWALRTSPGLPGVLQGSLAETLE